MEEKIDHHLPRLFVCNKSTWHPKLAVCPKGKQPMHSTKAEREEGVNKMKKQNKMSV